MAASVGKLQIELDLALGKLTSSISVAQKQISGFAAKTAKSLNTIGINASLEIAKKAIEGLTKAWKFLIQGSETEQFNASIEKVQGSFESLRSNVGESITRSEAFNEALKILAEWLDSAAAGTESLGTKIGDGLAFALASARAPLVAFKAVLGVLNGLLVVTSKGVSVLLAVFAKLVAYTPPLRLWAEAVKAAGGPDLIAGIDGLSKAFGDISSGALEQATAEFEAMSAQASALGSEISRVNAKAGARSSSASASSKKKGGAKGGPAKAGKAATMTFDAFPVEQSAESAAAIATANTIKAQAAALAASEESLQRLVEITDELKAKLDEILGAYVEIASFAGGVILDAVFQPLEDGMLDIEKIVGSVKAAVIDLIKQLIMAAALKAAFGVATGGVGGAVLTAMGFASGGLVGGAGGPTSDSNLAWVSRGEYVMDAATVDRYGAGFFSALQKRRLPAFAAGGLVKGAGAISVGAPARGGDSVYVSAIDPKTTRDVVAQRLEVAHAGRYRDRQGSLHVRELQRAAKAPRTGA